MTGLEEKKPTYAPAYVVGIYPRLAEIARAHGYALALHGSVQRDLDLIAVPWTDGASDHTVLLSALCESIDVSPNGHSAKPHGRLAWSIPLWWGAYIDLSILPPNSVLDRVEPAPGSGTKPPIA